jgi:hypothetical protein
MDLAGYVVNAVLVEGQSVKEVCEAHISRSWLYELIARCREGGDEGLRRQSKRPHSSPTRVPASIEDEIVALRKELTDLGVDAGAHTIHYHLQVRYRRRRRVGALGGDDLAGAVSPGLRHPAAAHGSRIGAGSPWGLRPAW